MAIPTIVAMGGGTFDQPYDPTRERFIFSLARRSRPSIAFLGTASVDSEAYTANFFRSVGGLECDATDLPLFERREADLRRVVLALDIIYVGGGNTLSLLAVWRTHRLDELLREAWEEGIVLPMERQLVFRGSQLEDVVRLVRERYRQSRRAWAEWRVE